MHWGKKWGAFRRLVAEKLQSLHQTAQAQGNLLADSGLRALIRPWKDRATDHPCYPMVEQMAAWLQRDYALDRNSAWHVLDYVAGPLDVAGATHEQVRQALQAWVTYLARFESHLTVEMWNGVPVLESDGRPVLEEAGFYHDYPAMRWEKR